MSRQFIQESILGGRSTRKRDVLRYMKELTWDPFAEGLGIREPSEENQDAGKKNSEGLKASGNGKQSDGAGKQGGDEETIDDVKNADRNDEGVDEENTFGNPEGDDYAYCSNLTTSGKKKIVRLLELFPGELTDDIKCKLEQWDLEKAPEYEALSYCWGDPDTGTKPIVVDGSILQATVNLRSALRYLRRNDQKRVLWVDAICINQSDLDERMCQVGIMRDIYQNAQQVLIWLGRSDEETQENFRVIAALAHEARQKEAPAKRPNTIEKVEVGGDRESSIGTMVNSGWFTRTWVVQEIILARRARVIQGDISMDWDVLSQGMSYGLEQERFRMHVLGITSQTDMDLFQAVASSRHRRLRDGYLPSERLLDLLIQFRVRKATNPRDKVYALLGLVPNVEKLDIQPTYRNTVAGLYRHVAKKIILESGNLDVVGAAFQSCEEQLPSWVVDWSDDSSLSKPFRTYGNGELRPGRAAGEGKDDLSFIDENTLVVNGHAIDEITEIGEKLRNVLSDHEVFLDFENDVPTEPGEEPEKETSTEETSTEGTSTEETDESFSSIWKELKADFKDIKKDFSEIKGDGAAFGRIIFAFLEPIQTILEWEKLAGITSKAQKKQSPHFDSPSDIYWQTLCAGNLLVEGKEATRKVFWEWFHLFDNIRRMLWTRMDRLPKMFKPMAFAAWLRATWSGYSSFGFLLEHAYGRRLARTKSGRLVLVPGPAELGDSIVLCKGGRFPLVLRRDESLWRIVGEAYVHGVMDGEAFEARRCQPMHIR